MEVANMDLYLVQSLIEEFVSVYGKQFEELVNCISEIKKLDKGILKEHWSGEGRNSFKAKINEWADSLKDCKTMMKTAKEAVSTLDEDTDKLVELVASIKVLEKGVKYVDPYRKSMM